MRTTLYGLLVAIFFLLGTHSAQADPPPKQLNVILIVADDLNTNMGCYGHPLVKTPNLDRLVQRGVRFEHAYCQSPICNPSRTSFLSGLRPGNKSKEVVFLPNHFRAQGYVTAEIGKVTHSYGITATAIQWDINKDPKIDHALEFLREKPTKPFFLAVGMTQTHPGYSFNRKYLDQYRASKLKLLEHPPDLLKTFPKTAFKGILVQNLTVEERTDHIARYYAAISTLDEQVGLLLDAVDQLQLWDSTIVIFTSDHGRHLGEFGGVYDKRTLFEASVRVPLIVAAPGAAAGKTCPRLVELLDLYPTLNELCQLPQPRGLQGKSLAPLLQDPAQPWKKAAFSSVQVSGTAARTVRTEQYRFIEWPGQEQAALFDYQVDPQEMRNLFSDPKYGPVVQEMRSLLKSGS